MTDASNNDDFAELRSNLTDVKRTIARFIAQSQVGGDRKVRREMTRDIEKAKRRGRNLQIAVDEFLTRDALSDELRKEVEQAARFLSQLQALKTS